MIKPEQIPDEVGYAASKALHSYPELGDFKVAIAAAINAWPKMSTTAGLSSVDAFGSHHPVHPMTIHLPLPLENNDG